MSALLNFEKWVTQTNRPLPKVISPIDRIGFKLHLMKKPLVYLEPRRRTAILIVCFLAISFLAFLISGLVGNFVFRTSRFTELHFWLIPGISFPVLGIFLIFSIRYLNQNSADKLQLPPWETFETGTSEQ